MPPLEGGVGCVDVFVRKKDGGRLKVQEGPRGGCRAKGRGWVSDVRNKCELF